jgi:hypothetical protein
LPEIENKELNLAESFVEETGTSIFLTGKAGTGKTTFLETLSRKTSKRFIVTAPTGVAAINAGGVTLHSFFQLPFGPFVPGQESEEFNKRKFRFSREKKNIIKNLDLLIIDEISMVRADVLDSVDAVLKRFRRSNLPFGGVQLLMIGDLSQLSPVAKNQDWSVLKDYYDSVYFFSSRALMQTEYVTIELKHIYRQKDEKFIKILNRLRDNALDDFCMEELNKRYIKDYVPENDQGCVVLTTHNKTAEAFNRKRLEEINEKEFVFKADISGDFPDHSYPAPEVLKLKKGAQVMFLRNDSPPDKKFYNGKTGTITEINNEKIKVFSPEDELYCDVSPSVWENIKYSLDDNNEIQSETSGLFRQYPLKPAWAITIHKSQGLTFDKAVIDGEAAFAHGQIYVALSRCKTLEGLVLSSYIKNLPQKDPILENFDENIKKSDSPEEILEDSKINFQKNLLIDCFDFRVFDKAFRKYYYLLKNNENVVHIKGFENKDKIINIAEKDIFEVSEKFKNQLNKIFSETNTLPEKDRTVLERINKASKWFQEKLSFIKYSFLNKIVYEADNKEIKKQLDNAYEWIEKEWLVKFEGVKFCEKGFNPSQYLKCISSAQTEKPSAKKEKPEKLPEFNESDIVHEDLFTELKKWRSEKAKQLEVKSFQILHQSVLIQIAVNLPDNRTDLLKAKGMGDKKFEQFGEELIEIVSLYRKNNSIEHVDIPEPPPEINKKKDKPGKNKKSEPDTKTKTFSLFNKGFAAEQISKERGLAVSTIESHLSFFVEKGELGIEKFVNEERRKIIEQAFEKSENHLFSEVKNILGDDFTYGEIKMVSAYKKSIEKN